MRMSFPLNGSPVLQHSIVIEIHNGMKFDFYTNLSVCCTKYFQFADFVKIIILLAALQNELTDFVIC